MWGVCNDVNALSSSVGNLLGIATFVNGISCASYTSGIFFGKGGFAGVTRRVYSSKGEDTLRRIKSAFLAFETNGATSIRSKNWVVA